jgi:hypothetical protein
MLERLSYPPTLLLVIRRLKASDCLDSRKFLNLPPGDFVGWLRVDSDIFGVVGDVCFGDPNKVFESAVELQRTPVPDSTIPTWPAG